MADLNGVVVGEYGKTITLTMKDSSGNVQDISTYTSTKNVTAKPPSGYKTVTATASFLTDGSDGKINFSFADGDIDQAGLWECTVTLEKTGARVRSEMFTMEVSEAVQ